MSFEIENTPAPAFSAFEDLMALIKLAGDPKGFQRNLDALMAATIKATEAKAAAAKQEASLAARKAEQDAAFAKREAEISATAEAWADRKADVDDKHERLSSIHYNIVTTINQFKREILRYAGVTRNESMQDLPDWSQMAAEVLGISDVHFDGNDSSGRPETSYEIEPPPNLVAGSTLTRRSPRPPRPTRADMVRGA